jgi:hypothetical protein
MAAVGELFGEKYQLDQLIERAGTTTTEVFRATDVECGVGLEVIVEIARGTATSVEKARFATRARRLSQIRHPSLMSALDVGPTHCAFEAPIGVALGEHSGLVIARSRQKLFWLSQLASALAALHKGGIVHGRVSLSEALVLPDVGVKLSIPLGGEITASPLDDVRAFARSACTLILGNDVDPTTLDEPTLANYFTESGVPAEGSITLARSTVGQALTSEDLAERLAPFINYTGPTTEPLLPVVRKSTHD